MDIEHALRLYEVRVPSTWLRQRRLVLDHHCWVERTVLVFATREFRTWEIVRRVHLHSLTTWLTDTPSSKSIICFKGLLLSRGGYSGRSEGMMNAVKGESSQWARTVCIWRRYWMVARKSISGKGTSRSKSRDLSFGDHGFVHWYLRMMRKRPGLNFSHQRPDM